MIRGIVLGSERPDELIIRATEQEVARYGSQQKVVVSSPGAKMAPGSLMGMTLYSADGIPVAILTDMEMVAQRLDVTSHGSQFQEYVAGPVRIDIRAQGINGEELMRMLTG